MSCVEDFMDYLRVRKRYSARTLSLYSDAVKRFYGFVGSEEEDTGALTSRNIRAFIADCLDKKLSPESVNLMLSGLSTYCNYLLGQERIEVNPVRGVFHPKEKKRLPEFYTQEAMREYFEMTEGADEKDGKKNGEKSGEYATRKNPAGENRYGTIRDRMIIRLIYDTGMRRAEVASLRLTDYNPARHVFRITGKGNKEREIPVVKDLEKKIDLYLAARENFISESREQGRPADSSGREEAFFLTDSCRPLYPAFINNVVRRELSGIRGFSGKKSPHVLRHSFATALLNNGADLNSIKEVLGHSSLAATEVYTHNSFEQLRKVYADAHPRAKKNE